MQKYILFLVAIIFCMIPVAGHAEENIVSRLRGYIVLQVEARGEAWYVDPVTRRRYFLGRPHDAFQLMRARSIGVTNATLSKIPPAYGEFCVAPAIYDPEGRYLDPACKRRSEALYSVPYDAARRDDRLIERLRGHILLQVEGKGEAWYLDPTRRERYFLGHPSDAFDVMRRRGLGITNADLAAIPVAEVTGNLHASVTVTPTSTTPIGSLPVGETIMLKGDGACQQKIRAALELLQARAREHRAVVNRYVGVIECAAQGSGMFAWERPPRYLVGQQTIDAGTVWLAGTIVHDACHSKQYNDYAQANAGVAVPENIYSGATAEAQCLDAQEDALVDIGASQEILTYVRTISTDYANIPYAGRWW